MLAHRHKTNGADGAAALQTAGRDGRFEIEARQAEASCGQGKSCRRGEGAAPEKVKLSGLARGSGLCTPLFRSALCSVPCSDEAVVCRLEAELAQSTGRSELLDHKVSEARNTVAAQGAAIELLKQQISSLEAKREEVPGFRLQLQMAREEQRQVKVQLESREQEAAQLRAGIAEANATKARLRKDLKLQASQILELLGQLRDVRRELASALELGQSRRLEECAAERAGLREKVLAEDELDAERDDAVAALTRELKAREAEANEIAEQLAGAQQELVEALSRLRLQQANEGVRKEELHQVNLSLTIELFAESVGSCIGPHHPTCWGACRGWRGWRQSAVLSSSSRCVHSSAFWRRMLPSMISGMRSLVSALQQEPSFRQKPTKHDWIHGASADWQRRTRIAEGHSTARIIEIKRLRCATAQASYGCLHDKNAAYLEMFSADVFCRAHVVDTDDVRQVRGERNG